MYSKIDARFWNDEKIVGMSMDARYLMLYLLTSPHRNLFGCYKLPKAYIPEDTGISEKRFVAAWKELIQSGMIAYDDKTKTVLVCNFLKYNPIEGPKQVTGAITKLSEIPRTELLIKVADILIMQVKDKPYLEPLINAMRNSCDTLSDTLSNKQGIGHTKGYGIPVTVTDNSISNSNYIHEDDDSVYNNAHAHAHTHEAEEPYENITDYLDLSDTAYAMATDLETEQVEEYIRKSWKYHTGKSPNAANVGDIEACARLNDMEVATISEAISLAARNASGSITGYACQCLRDWASRGLHTLNEVYRAEISVNGGST